VARTASLDAGVGVPSLSASFEPVPACTPVSRLLVLPSMIIDSSPSPSPYPCVRRWVKVRPRALVRFFFACSCRRVFMFLHRFFCFSPYVLCLCLRLCPPEHARAFFPFVCNSILLGGRFIRFFAPLLFGWFVRVCVCLWG